MGSLKKLQGWYITGAEWLPIAVNVDGKVVLSNIPAHVTSHQLGGSDIIDLTGLHVPHHKTSHQDGGDDVISLVGLHVPHHVTTHQNSGDDEINIASIGHIRRSKAYLSAAQLNLVNATWTTVLLNAESYDIDNNFYTYCFTVPKTGYYLVIGTVYFGNVVASKEFKAALAKNAIRILEAVGQASVAGNLVVTFTDIRYFTIYDVITLQAYSGSGTNTVDIYGGEDATSLVINYLQV